MSKGIIFEEDTSISVTKGIIYYNGGFPPSKPRPSHQPPWASDGGEPSPRFWIRSEVSLSRHGNRDDFIIE